MSVCQVRYTEQTNFVSDQFVYIGRCGLNRYTFRGTEQEFTLTRPHGRVDYHILMAQTGRFDAVCNGVRYSPAIGDCVLYWPNDPQTYMHCVSAESPVSETRWIHFSGTAVAEALTEAGLTASGVYRPSSVGEARRLMEAIRQNVLCGHSLDAAGNLLRLFARLSPGAQVPDDPVRRMIHAEAEYIHAHIAEPINFDECARRCCLSRSRFSHLFADYVGDPPHRYQRRLRMEQARELLSYSDLSVSEIAAQLGYGDSLYFSRIFRKTVGQSPSAFRRSDDPTE